MQFYSNQIKKEHPIYKPRINFLQEETENYINKSACMLLEDTVLNISKYQDDFTKILLKSNSKQVTKKLIISPKITTTAIIIIRKVSISIYLNH